MRTSNHLIGLLNFLTFLLSIPILGGGIWLSTRANNTDCLKFLQWPIIIIGVSIMVVSLAGFAGACYRNSFLMYLYLWAMFFIIAALIGFIIFAYAVTDKGTGRPVMNRAYLEYHLEDYSGWLEERVASQTYWGKISSCIRESKVCAKMGLQVGGVPEAADLFYLRKLSPIQINKMCATFKKKTLEHRDLMETVFLGASATGKHHWTPGEEVPEAAADSSDSVHSLGAQPFADPIPAGVQDVDSDSSMDPVPIEKEKKRKTPSSSVSKSKKATSGASIIAESMNRMTDMVRTKNQQVTVRHVTGNESLFTISACMHRLTGITSLVGTPLFHFATSLMDNADLREVMMCQPDDDSIIGWLTQKQLQRSTSAPFANLFGPGMM